MRMAEIDFDGPPPIDSYGGGGFRLAGVFHTGGLLLLDAPQHWPVLAPEQASPATVARLIADAAAWDVALFGMGAEIAPLPRATRDALDAAGIGADVMSTAAACRTYNVLLAEGRRVAAALIAV